jgi:hypothetical protein
VTAPIGHLDRYGFAVPGVGGPEVPAPRLLPELNQLVVPAGQRDVLGQRLGVLEPAVLAALGRVRTGLARGLRRHAAAAESAFLDLFREEGPVPQTVDRLVGLHRTRRELADVAAPALETAVQVSVRRLLADEAYVDWFTSNYAADNDNQGVSRRTVADAMADLREAVDGPAPVPAFAETLDTVRDRHGPVVADAVEMITLDPPAVRPAGPAGSPPGRIAEVDIAARSRAVADALAAVEVAPTTPAPDELRLRIRERLNESPASEAASGEASTPREDLPLLDVPMEAADPSAGVEDATLIGHPSGEAWLFTRAFESGGLGAAVYARPSGDWSWMVNPWVAQQAVEEATFAAAWQRAFFAGYALEELFDRARVGDPAPIACPFCAMADDACGVEGCGFDPALREFNDRLGAIVEVLQDVPSDR